MNKDFEIVETSRFEKTVPEESRRNTKLNFSQSERKRIGEAVADNMEGMVEIAKDMIEIKKMQVQSEAVLKKLEEDRKMLQEQTKAYVEKKRVNSEYQLDRMEKIRLMLKDFYQLNDQQRGGLSGEEFASIVKQVIGMDEVN